MEFDLSTIIIRVMIVLTARAGLAVTRRHSPLPEQFGKERETRARRGPL